MSSAFDSGINEIVESHKSERIMQDLTPVTPFYCGILISFEEESTEVLRSNSLQQVIGKDKNIHWFYVPTKLLTQLDPRQIA